MANQDKEIFNIELIKLVKELEADHIRFVQFIKGNRYRFLKIALPVVDVVINKTELKNAGFAQDAHSDSDEIRKIKLYGFQGVILIDRDVQHVLYQREENIGVDNIWARMINDFFGYKKKDDSSLIKRFLKEFNEFDCLSYRTNEPCAICGKIENNRVEPRFKYVVCRDHYLFFK